MAESKTVAANRNGIELPLLLFALFALLAISLPSRERALLPFGDATGFLAQSAADERLPNPFGYTVDDPVGRTGFAVLDGAGRLLNPVLRSGGAGSRKPARGLQGADRGADVALPNDPTQSLGIVGDTAFAAAEGIGNPGGGGTGNPGASGGSSGGAPGGGIDGQPVPPFGGNFAGSLLGFGAVPEPMTWMLLILGFGSIGHMLRRRRAGSLA